MAENVLHDFEGQVGGGVTLVPSSGGVFEVSLDGETIFSKRALGRFPNENEIEGMLEGRLGG